MYESQKEKIELNGAVQSLDRCWRALKNAQRRYRSSNRDEESKERDIGHYVRLASDEMYQFEQAIDKLDLDKVVMDEKEFRKIIKGDKQI